MTVQSRQTALVQLLADVPIIPVVVIDSEADALPLASALVAGGLPCAEVTLRTPASLAALRVFAEQPNLLVGAGSVTTASQAERAVRAGARFVVSPGFSESVVAACVELGVPVLPGVATATEIMRAIDAGIDVVKLFPVSLLGGPAAVRGLGAPFPELRFVPTGGIDADNVRDYLSIASVLSVGGSWMVAPALCRAGQFDEITRLVRCATALAAEVRHGRD